MNTTSTSTLVGTANESEYAQLAMLVDRHAPGLIANWDAHFQSLKSFRVDPTQQKTIFVAREASSQTLTGAIVLSRGVKHGDATWAVNSWMHIEALVIEDARDRISASRHLIQLAITNASQSGFVGMYGVTEDDSSEVADFYESCGFEVIPTDRGVDPLEPERTLCPAVIEAPAHCRVVASSTAHGRSRGRDWYRIV